MLNIFKHITGGVIYPLDRIDVEQHIQRANDIS